MDAAATPLSLMAGAVATLAGVVAFLFFEVRRLNQKLLDQANDHKSEVKELQNETITIVTTQTEKHYEANAPVMRLLEATISTTRPK